jgi:hypothetical protein
MRWHPADTTLHWVSQSADGPNELRLARLVEWARRSGRKVRPMRVAARILEAALAGGGRRVNEDCFANFPAE